MASAIVSQVVRHLEALPHNLQEQVLNLVRALDSTSQRGTSGNQLLRFAGTIPQEDLQIMSEVIEQGCERIDPDEW